MGSNCVSRTEIDSVLLTRGGFFWKFWLGIFGHPHHSPNASCASSGGSPVRLIFDPWPAALCGRARRGGLCMNAGVRIPKSPDQA
jgi:hypothetical protein